MMPTESPVAGTQRWYKSHRLGLYALLAFSAILLIGWTFAVPMFESPDEGTHWDYARYLHDQRRLPHYDQSMIEGNQPPIYYLSIAPFAVESARPRTHYSSGAAGLVLPCSPRIYNVCPSDFSRFWPIRNARVLTSLFSVLTVLFVYMAGKEISGSHEGGILAGTLLICLPEFAFRGGNISNDGMVATTSALATYWIIRLMRRGFSVQAGIIASVCVALAFLSKISAIILVPVLAVVLLGFPGDWKLRLKRLSVMLAAAACVTPWIIRNQILYGEPLASKAMITVVPALIDIKPLWSPWFLNVFPAAMANSLVGAFGGIADIYLPPSVNHAIGYLVLMAFAGLAYSLLRGKTDWKVALALFALVLLAVASAVQLNMILSQPQGRYLFAGLPALVVLTATGLRGLPGWNRYFQYAMIGALGCLSIYALFGIEVPSFWKRTPPSTTHSVTDTFILFPSPAATPAGPLRQGEIFGQTFVSKGANLSSVEVVVATYGKKLNSGLVKLHLRTSLDALQDIASVTIPATQITDNMFVALAFPPIADSKGRTFYFFVEAQSFASSDAVTLWISKSNVYQEGQFYRNGQPTDYDMLMRAGDTSRADSCGDCEQ